MGKIRTGVFYGRGIPKPQQSAFGHYVLGNYTVVQPAILPINYPSYNQPLITSFLTGSMMRTTR